jgi:hypothetical protein
MNLKAYFSTPEHNRSIVGRWIWCTQNKGSFGFGDLGIECRSSAFKLQIKKERIESIELGTFPRTAKPIPFRYIDVKHKNEMNDSEHIYIVPLIPGKYPWFTPVWTTNKHTVKILDQLNQWRQNQSLLDNA